MRIIKRVGLLVASLLAITSCGGAGQVEFDYVHLQNNVNGFVTSDGDTAIAIGLKKGSSLNAFFRYNGANALIQPEHKMIFGVQRSFFTVSITPRA